MKVGILDTLDSATAVATPKERKPAAAPAGASSAPAPSAQVALSSTASLLTQGASDPTFDTAKVSRIAQAIQDGNFKVNHEAIADKLIANAQELLGRRGTH